MMDDDCSSSLFYFDLEALGCRNEVEEIAFPAKETTLNVTSFEKLFPFRKYMS